MNLINGYQSDSDDQSLPEMPPIIDFTFNKAPKSLTSKTNGITTYVYIEWKLQPNDSLTIAKTIENANEILGARFSSFNQLKLVKESLDCLHVSLSYNLKFSHIEMLDNFIGHLRDSLPKSGTLCPLGKPYVLPNPDSSKLFLAVPFEESSQEILASLTETINNYIDTHRHSLSLEADESKKENSLYDASMTHLSIGVRELNQGETINPEYLENLNQILRESKIFAKITAHLPTSILVSRMRSVVEIPLS